MPRIVRRGGQPEGYCHWDMIDAMLYVDDNGTTWRALPVDFPDFLWNPHEARMSAGLAGFGPFRER